MKRPVIEWMEDGVKDPSEEKLLDLIDDAGDLIFEIVAWQQGLNRKLSIKMAERNNK